MVFTIHPRYGESVDNIPLDIQSQVYGNIEHLWLYRANNFLFLFLGR